MKLFKSAILVVSVLALAACQNPPRPGTQGQVKQVSSKAVHRIDTKPTMNDYQRFSSQLALDMITSDEYGDYVTRTGNDRPKIVINRFRNRTQDENIIIDDVRDFVKRALMRQGGVRIVSKQSTSFDLIVNGTITSLTQRNTSGDKFVQYLLKLTMSDLDGEEIGTWQSNVLGLTK